MLNRNLEQLRARLMSLRDQRNRMVHRASDLDRRANELVRDERRRLDQARSNLAQVQSDVARLKVDVESFERGHAPEEAARLQTAWRAASDQLMEAERRRSELEATVQSAERTLQRALANEERASTEKAVALARLEQEIAELTVEIGRLQAERPPVEAPDPRFREVLLGRLQHLEGERNWIGEEIAQREERLRRIGVEVSQIRSLLDMHTPEWGRDALDTLASDAADRIPSWKQGVMEILSATEAPLHYREIAEMLAATGRSLGGQDPAETLLAALSRDQDIVRVGRGTYWLRSRQLQGEPLSPTGTPPVSRPTATVEEKISDPHAER
jgi:hypothetical protein